MAWTSKPSMIRQAMQSTNTRICNAPTRLFSRSSVRLTVALTAPSFCIAGSPYAERPRHSSRASVRPGHYTGRPQANAQEKSLSRKEVDRLGRRDRFDVVARLELELQDALDETFLELGIVELRDRKST